MGKQEELAALLYQLKADGIDVGRSCVVDEGVFFPEHVSADGFAKHYDKELVRVDGHVSGWLAKNKPVKEGTD